ncbi:Uncharacterised protein [Mycobacteroides abscessus subsp. massiliense]|nr:hypothetical protein Chelonae_p4580 [Mycobacterium sp. QIA-37]SKV90550.1 Uncharacterised protein [Mycobacteroides abscessus subsp. massiliense]
MIHGLPGFQLGCRCGVCSAAESARLGAIGENEAGRWRQVNARADSVWAQRVNTPEPHLRWVRWTEREIAYALDRSRSLRYIARMLGRSASAVSAIRRKHRDTASNDA